MVGEQLSHYRILAKLGRGGMGEVYEAEDTKLNRRVALKILPKELAADPERRERFEREAKAVAALNHPNIVTIHSVEEADGTHFFTMELVEGEPLSARIPDDGLALDEFFDVALPLVTAVSAAHLKGITHRDLKPNNVMITDERHVKVLDFGLAKLAEVREGGDDATRLETSFGTGQLTEDGQIVGTVSYMSPEQAEGKPVDPRSDVFSLGALLYEMATGEQAFQGDTKISIITSIMRDDPPSVTEVRRELPDELGRVINRCLAKKPGRRFQSTVDLRNELDELRTERQTDLIRQSAVGMEAVSAGRRLPALPLLGGLALLAALIVAGMAIVPRLGSDSAGSGSATPAAVTADTRPSLAVLYFDNLAGDEALEWLRTGLTDMLVTDLSQSPALRVLGTDRLHQILTDMGRVDDPMTSFDLVQAVAAEAQVDHVLLGSFARAGDTIRISARLQSVTDGEILTSQRVEGEGEESIFELVDDLTRLIKAEFEMPAAMMAADVDKDLTEVTTSSVEAYRYYAEGVNLHEDLKDAEAIPLLERALEHDPNFAMALAKLSVAHGNTDNIAMAREYAERAMQHLDRVSDRERFYIEGRYYSLTPETVDDAITAYEKAIENYPDHTSARNNLAQQYLGIERFEDAIEHLEYLRRNGMRFPGTYGSLAQAYGRVGQMEQGLEVLRAYLSENPDNAAGYRNLAEHLIWSGRPDDALEALAPAERLDPANYQNDSVRWQVYLQQERWDDAQRLAETGTGHPAPPVRFGHYAALASTHLHRGKLKSALEALEEAVDAVEIGQLQSQVLRLMADVQMKTGRAAEAVRTTQRALAAAADDFNSEINAAVVAVLAQAAAGDRAAAERAFEDVWQRAEELPAPPRLLERQRHQLRGVMAFFAADWAGAERETREALRLMPPRMPLNSSERLNAHYILGVAVYEQGRPEEAVEWFQQAGESTQHTFDPIPWVRSFWYLGKIHEERGQMEEAGRNYRRFLHYWGDGEIDVDNVEHAREVVG